MKQKLERTWVSTGGHWEDVAGYARAVRVGNKIWISGTTATEVEGKPIQDPAEQIRLAIRKIEKAIEQLGGSLADVVQTRIYISDLKDIEAVARAHGESFKAIRPANMLSQVGLSPGILVEIEAEAVIGSDKGRQLSSQI